MRDTTLRRFTSLGCALLCATLLAECSSPPPTLYTVAPLQGAAVRSKPKVVLLRDIGLARYLDRSQIVRSSENYRLDVMTNDWWGESLGAMLSRVLVEELSQRLPGTTVYAEAGAVTTRPDVTVELNIQRMDEDRAGGVVLLAQADIHVTGRPGSTARTIRTVIPVQGSGTSAEVTAISTAVGQLADELAAMLG